MKAISNTVYLGSGCITIMRSFAYITLLVSTPGV
jgi:hypothetical protein